MKRYNTPAVKPLEIENENLIAASVNLPISPDDGGEWEGDAPHRGWSAEDWTDSEGYED